ncbi:PDK repeat-containing protein [Nakamurella endophytica]|uniref:PDK repeat-containing protein n=2 Tax=Nakamurella endophytica TaxID=1748367 RepID=A0A917WAF4_9ACTN|nr:PDK repeat-containing protein [Nakamurella endophytica]
MRPAAGARAHHHKAVVSTQEQRVRPRPLFRTALTATVAAALAAVGLVAAPATASAEPASEQQRSDGVVTADALPTAQIDGVVWSQAIAGNTVFAGGQFTKGRPAGSALGQNEVARSNLLAYNLSTGALTSFAPVVNNQVRSVALSPDGKRVYIGGYFTAINGTKRDRIAAFDVATGTLIASFAPSVDYTVETIVATNSTVYVGGAFTNGGTRNRLAAFSASTGALLNWAPSADSTVRSMVLAPDGSRLIVGGFFTTINGQSARGTASIDATTGALLPWALNSVVTNSGTNSAILSLSTDGTSIYGGGFKFGSDGNLEGMFKADPYTGAVQWIEDCHGDTYGVYANSAAVYNVGHAHYCGNDMGWPQPSAWKFNRAIAFTPDATGTLLHDNLGYTNWVNRPSPSLQSWFPKLDPGTYTGKDQAAWTVTGNSDYVVLGGEFVNVNGKAQQGLARFAVKSLATNKQGPFVSSADLTPTLTTPSAGAVKVAVPAAWDRDDRQLTYTLQRNGVAIWTTTVGSAEWERPMVGYTDTGLTPGQTVSYRFLVKDPSGNQVLGQSSSVVVAASGSVSSYGQTVLGQGASLYWPMNDTGAGVARDLAGYNDAVLDAGVTPGAAGAVPGDTGMTFAGNTTATASTKGALVAPNVFSASVWFRTTSTSGGRILGFSDMQTGTSAHRDRQIYMGNTGKLNFGVWGNGASASTSLQTVKSYNDGAWHQAVAELSPAGMVLYVDGVKVGSRTDVTAGEKYVGYWRAGGDSTGGYANAGSSGYLNGTLDEIAVFPTALSQAQVVAQYNASGRTSTVPSAPADKYGSAVYGEDPTLFWRLGDASAGTTAADSGPGVNPGTYQGSVAKQVAGAISGVSDTAVTFDGATGFVSSNASFTNPTTYSLESWFKTTSTTGGKIIGFGTAKTGLSTSYDRHVYMQADGRVAFGAYNNGKIAVASPAAYNNGQWHHVVATMGSTGMNLYLDGARVAGNPNTGSQNYTGYWRVGGDASWSGGAYFNGTIDEAAVYPKVLTAAQVAQHYQTGAAVNAAPTAAFTATVSNLRAAVDGSASADTDGTVAGYAWNFGDGGTGTGATATHDYAAAGTYTVTLTVTDDAGATNTVSHPVTVTLPPNVAPTASFTASSDNLAITVDGSGSSDPDGTVRSYAWNFGDGGNATTATAMHTYAAAGTYTVTLTVTDDRGDTGTVTKSVTVSPANQTPTASWTSTADGLGLSVDGSASADPDGTIASYAWNFGDGGTGSGATATHTYPRSGDYQVTLMVTDDRGGKDTATRTVTVTAPNSAPTASWTSTAAGLTLSVDGSASKDTDGTISSYSWDFGDGATATGKTASHTYATAGSYVVTLTVKDDGGLAGTSARSVTVSDQLFADAFGRTVPSGWGTADVGGAWAVTSGTPAASVAGGYGLLPTGKGVTRTASLSSVQAADVDLSWMVNLDKAPTGGSTMVSGSVRKTSSGEYRTTVVFTTTGTVTLQLVRISGGVSTTLKALSVAGLRYTAGSDLHVRFSVAGTTDVTLQAKVWLDGTTEPDWQSSVIDPSPAAALQGSGSVALVAYVSSAATNAPVTVGVKDLTGRRPVA